MGHVGRMGPVGVAVCLAGCCCMFPNVIFDLTRTRPDKKEIIGIWHANAKTLKWLKEQGYDTSSVTTFEFRDDDTFTMTGMPDCWREAFESDWQKTFESGSGTWSLEEDEGYWEIELLFKRPPWFPDGVYHTSLRLFHQEPPYIARTYVDPNQFNFLDFERQ
jgi:hypothetical protein